MKGRLLVLLLAGVGACTASSSSGSHGHRHHPKWKRPVDPVREVRIEKSRLDPLAELARSERGEPAEAVPLALEPYQAPEVDLASPVARPHLPSTPSFPHVYVEWPRTCERRGRLPDDELAYIEAWCADFVHGDSEKAIVGLQAVAKTAQTPGLAIAARADIVGFVARSPRSPEVAMQLLENAGLTPSAAAELLFDAYTALGLDADAHSLYAWRGAHAQCAARVREVIGHANDGLEARLHAIARDGACALAVLAARCDLGLESAATCHQPTPPPPPTDAQRVAAVFRSWHAHAGADAWRQLAADVVTALPMRGAEGVAIAALANALVDECEPTLVAAVVEDARSLRRRPDHDPRYDRHLAILAQATPSACEATHARHLMP